MEILVQQRARIRAVGLLFAALPWAIPVDAATPCENLPTLRLSNARIDSARMVQPGGFVDPDGRAFGKLPAFCRVAATLTPSRDSAIKIEVWLPASGWNGKLRAFGNGGWGGTIAYDGLGFALAYGYASAATDGGHTGDTADFALGHHEKVIDLAYRAVHEMAVQSKAVISAYYGTPASFAYFTGCSTAGMQGLAEAQKHPEDFNGIIAEAASWNQMRLYGTRLALNLIVNKDPDSVIPPAKYPMIHQAALNACDALDGLKDGVIENPMKCQFDYASLACKGKDEPDCLTKGQVESAQALTSPLKDPKTGRVLFEGHLMPGTELSWAGLAGPRPPGSFISGMQNLVFQDRTWDYRAMNLSTDVDRAAAADHGAMYAGDPNLKPFFDRGGKLLMIHGWSDARVTPLSSVIYYNNVLAALGKDDAAGSIALFMVPGVGHCGGGVGADRAPWMRVMEEWTEQGRKPAQVLASRVRDGRVDRTRLLCAFPSVARYKGMGDPDDAANFSCVAEDVTGTTPATALP
jgi:feruloyl esterase